MGVRPLIISCLVTVTLGIIPSKIPTKNVTSTYEIRTNNIIPISLILFRFNLASC